MDFKTISTELENEGYSTQFHKSINSLAIWIDENGEPKKQSHSRVEQIDNKMLFVYFIAQTPVEKEFKTIEELLKFVRQVFPVGN